MPTYNVEMLVSFVGEIEANSESEAENLAVYDRTCNYDGVYEIVVREIEEYLSEDEDDE